MSTPIILSLVGLVAIILIARMVTKSKGNTEQYPKPDPSDNIDFEEVVVPENLQNEYNRGMNPLEATDLTFYTLTNCVHCDRLEKFMHTNEIPYATILLDKFEGAARKNLMAKVRSYNPRGSFPTLVSPEGDVTIGFREWQVREKFMKYSLREENTENK